MDLSSKIKSVDTYDQIGTVVTYENLTEEESKWLEEENARQKEMWDDFYATSFTAFVVVLAVLLLLNAVF